ncbi:MAG: protein kinase, partial [Gammaproteobacteria bacterium]|nr:protein kinase [Gammaproteobacteria bacterium]
MGTLRKARSAPRTGASSSGATPTVAVHASRDRETGLASMGQVFRRLLEMHGLDAVGIARQAGVDLATLPGPAERVESDKLDVILRVAIPLIEDPVFGLQAARCWHPANLGVLGHAWLSSSTLGTGFDRMARYFAVIGQRAGMQVEETRQGVKVSFRRNSKDPAVAAVIADIGMSILLDMCRMNAGAALRPVAVTLCRGKPGQADAYERFFGCPVHFGAEENAFALSAKDVDRPLPSSNKQLAAVFDRMLAEELGRLDKSDVVARCRAAVLEDLESGETLPLESDSLTLTQEGKVLGTPTYMSPEQARGKRTDRRTDIWAFGCVLYEMLAGDSPYQGETLTDSLGAILHKEPDWSRLPADTPAPARLLLRRCLAKDQDQRLRDIGDARVEIEEFLRDPSASR